MRFPIPFDREIGGTNLGSLSAAWDKPRGAERGSAVLLAHGAGAHMESVFMRAVAEGLADRGFGVLRFNYPYFERSRRDGKRRAPDRQPILEEAHAAALVQLRERAGSKRIVLAGKSLGGRMSSLLAAKDQPCDALALFAYPLHPPGKPEKLRSEHFPAIAQPTLFLQGSRDRLCDLQLLRPALETFGGVVTLEVIDQADHGFHVPKRTGKTDADVLKDCLERFAAWEATTFPD